MTSNRYFIVLDVDENGNAPDTSNMAMWVEAALGRAQTARVLDVTAYDTMGAVLVDYAELDGPWRVGGAVYWLPHSYVWTADDSRAASAEGWGMFDNNERGLEIACCSLDSPLANDDAALAFVFKRASEDSDLHMRALAIHNRNR